MRGKIAGSSNTADTTSSHVFYQPHRFEKYNFTTLSNCDVCSTVLWNPVKVHMVLPRKKKKKPSLQINLQNLPDVIKSSTKIM